MHRIGEIDQGRPLRQVDQVAFRGETEHLVLEHLQFGVFQKFFRPGGMVENIQQFPQPPVLAPFPLALALLVLPMGGHAVFRHLVHVGGTNLNFNTVLFGTKNARVQGLVAVRFRGAHVILETSRYHRIGAMDDSQRLVALFQIVDDDPKGHDVGQLFKTDILVLHLFPDRIRRFFAPDDGRLQPARVQGCGQFIMDPFGQHIPLLAQEIQAGDDRITGIGVNFGERHIFQFVLQFLHADAFSQGREDVHSFHGDAAAFICVLDEMQGPHVVQPVGQLNQQNADVLGHGEQQFTEIFGLLGVVRLQFDAG